MSAANSTGSVEFVEDLIRALRRWQEYHRMTVQHGDGTLKSEIYDNASRVLTDGTDRYTYLPKVEALREQSGQSRGMSIERARELLKDEIQTDGGLYNLGHYLSWEPGEDHATLDDGFSIDELEAIVVYVRHHATSRPTCPCTGAACAEACLGVEQCKAIGRTR